MAKPLDLSGQRFGMWTVLRQSFPSRHDKTVWECKCDCGNIVVVVGQSLKDGVSTNCGCQVRRRPGPKKKHGQTKSGGYRSPTYTCWVQMRVRCTNPAYLHYGRYGGRGITVCERWNIFENFVADMGERPSREYTLERIDNDGNYDPGNCRWATRWEQAQNRHHAAPYDPQPRDHITGRFAPR